MAGIACDHVQIGVLIGILEAKFKAKAVGQRQTVVNRIARVHGVSLIAAIALNDVPAVRRHAQPDIVWTRFHAALQ